MRSVLFAITVLLCAAPAGAQEKADKITADVIEGHVLPGFAHLAEAGAALSEAAEADCRAEAPTLRDAYQTAFDAWMGVSHLRFGPTEAETRAFALAYWPDPRGATPKTLSRMIAAADDAVGSPEAFAQVSVAARGFYALDHLLYDERLMAAGSSEYRCALIRAVAADIARTAQAIDEDWTGRYAALMLHPGPDGTYRSRVETRQELFKALTAGLQFLAETRLGLPLGTFEKPRPRLAEARRSGRPLRNVRLALEATERLALLLSAEAPDAQAALRADFDRARGHAEALDDPLFAGVAKPQGRFRVEALQSDVESLRRVVAAQLGPSLGVAAGFNALDGD